MVVQVTERYSEIGRIEERDEYGNVICEACGEQPNLVWNKSMEMPEIHCKCGMWECGDYAYPRQWAPEQTDSDA